MSNAAPDSPTRSSLLATLRHRPRLLAAFALAIVAYFALGPAGLRESTRALVAWNAGAWAFLALIAQMMAAGQGRAQPNATAEDEGQGALLVLSVVAASAAVGAILWELGPVKNMEGFDKGAHIALVAGTVLSAWAFIHVAFALHYAGAYYDPKSDGAVAAGLAFPDCSEPGWGEFAYQAFVVGCAFATADVNVTTSEMRRVVIGHSIVAFVFNTVILALTINIAAGFV